MRTQAAAILLAGGLAVAAWQGAEALQQNEADAPEVAPPEPAKPASRPTTSAAPKRDASPPFVRAATPMAERVATLGVLNKRNGLWRDVVLKPGEARRVGDVVVRLRACEETAPWEPEHLTGAFVQADVRGRDARWRRVFSGWLYKESPSLNAVQDPIYDVWLKSCTMRHPETGPDTVAAGSGGAPAPKRSSAPKSPDEAAPPVPSPSAPSSNDT